ncbi:MAG: peptidylprolyl isomerase, partial [Gammaproteobacteria bacterium]
MKVEMTTSLGSITIELNQEKAPKTVENFLNYVESGFYEGTIFHRVIAGFMIQGGG